MVRINFIEEIRQGARPVPARRCGPGPHSDIVRSEGTFLLLATKPMRRAVAYAPTGSRETVVALRILLTLCFWLAVAGQPVQVMAAWPSALVESAAGSPELVSEGAPAVAGRLIVGLEPQSGFGDTNGPVPRLMTSRLFSSTEQILALGGGLFRLDLEAGADQAQAVERLRRDGRVRFVEPDYLLELFDLTGPAPFGGMPSDPGWPAQDEMRQIEANRAWEVTTGRPEIIIAMLDSGVLATHVDLTGKLLPGYDFLTNTPGAPDDQGHGTFTAALAAGSGNNGAGIAGVCWSCRIMPLKILNRDGRGPVSAFVQAIRYAVDNGARLINVSAGSTASSEAMREAVDYAYARNVLIVAAAGNRPEARPNYPAAFDRVLAVAAVTASGEIAGFSTFGAFVDIAAPGVNVLSASTAGNDRVRRESGTSVAAPLVTGAAGLVLALQPEASVDRLSELLLNTSVDIGPPGRDDKTGAGRLSVYDAVLAALRPEPSGNLRLNLAETPNTFRFRLTVGGLVANEAVRLWTTGQDGVVLVVRGLFADGRGNLEAPLELDNAQAGPQRLNVLGDRSRRLAVATLTIVLPDPAPFFQPVPPLIGGGERLYFPETGHSLGGGFRAYWEANGGLAIFGFPISEEFREINQTDGRTYTVQYFERNRFEYHPENRGTPYEVQLGLLGSLLTSDRTFAPAPAVPNSASRRYFSTTRHTLVNEFLTFWERNGDLAIFGYPISEAFEENGRLVQYFERNRFELHPTLPPQYRVSLGLLGNDLAVRNGYR